MFEREKPVYCVLRAVILSEGLRASPKSWGFCDVSDWLSCVSNFIACCFLILIGLNCWYMQNIIFLIVGNNAVVLLTFWFRLMLLFSFPQEALVKLSFDFLLSNFLLLCLCYCCSRSFALFFNFHCSGV